MSDDREYVDFKKLKAEISMRDLLAHYELMAQMERKSEGTLVGPCPITGSESQAFKVNEAKDVWYSFALEGDGEGGNILDFVARMENTDVLGAANLIDEWFDTEEEDSETEAPDDREEEATESPPDVYETFAELCEDEIGMLEDGARSDVSDVLDGTDQLDEEDREEVMGRVSRWILRSYRRGYELGKMQGRIDERVSRLG